MTDRSNPDAKGSPKPPPGLEVSSDEDRECDNCQQFLASGAPDPFDGRCTGYSLLPVCGEWHCKSWSPREPKNLKEARIQVRSHFRSRREQQRAKDDLQQDLDRGGRAADEKRNKISGTDY